MSAEPKPESDPIADPTLFQPLETRHARTLRLARWGLVASAITIILLLLGAAGRALTPFIIGLVMLYLLSPAVNFLSRRLPRWLSILVVYVLVAGLILLFVLLVVPPLASQIQRLIAIMSEPQVWRDIGARVLQFYQQNVPESLKAPIEEAMQNGLHTVQGNLTSYLQTALAFILSQLSQAFSLLSFLLGLLIVPIWLFYVLSDQRKAHVFLNRLLHYKIRPDFWNVWGLIDRSLSAYIRGQLTLGLIIGVAVGVGLSIIDLVPGLDIDYILLLAIWAGICELIPMVGAILGGAPGVILAFAIGGPTTGIVVLIMYTVVQQLENNLLVPRIQGESVGVHPAVLTVTLIVGASVFGLLGVILAAPVTAIARDLYRYTYRRLSGFTPQESIDGLSKSVEKRTLAEGISA